MDIVCYLFLEYVLIGKLHLQSLYKKLPQKWKSGHKGDVILIQGFGETWVFLEQIANYLNNEGYKIHTLPDLRYNLYPVEKVYSLLHAYISEKKLQNYILLSHSKGGLIGKYYMDTDPNNRAKLLISIAVPYQGSLWGYLSLFSLHEIKPKSKMIQRVFENKTNLAKILNLYTQVDNHIIPHSNALLPGANNVEISIIGHTRILHKKEVLESIKDYI